MPIQIFNSDPLKVLDALAQISREFPGQARKPTKTVLCELMVMAASNMDRNDLYDLIQKNAMEDYSRGVEIEIKNRQRGDLSPAIEDQG